MAENQTGNSPAFGHLRLLDYMIVIYCVLRILGKRQSQDLGAND